MTRPKGPAKVTRRCACRGLITANPEVPVEVYAKVRAHVEQPRHQAWQRSGGMYVPEDPEDQLVMVLRRVG